MDKTILESEALLMRPLEAGDIDEIPTLVEAPEIAANTFVPRPYTAEDAQEFVQRAASAGNTMKPTSSPS